MNAIKRSGTIILAGLVSLGLWVGVGPVRGAGLEETARAYNEFGLRLLAQCRQSLPKTNYFLSPAGLAFALSMLQNGAQRETLRQILKTLHGDNPLPQLNEDNKELLDHLLKSDPKVTLEIANSLWIEQKASIKPAFISVNQQDYGATVANGNFKDPALVKRINNWVSASTHGKIPTMIDAPLGQDDVLILLDAIYFKGDWLAQFDTNRTRDLPFTLGNGQIVQHPRMSRTGQYAYFEDDRFQAVELPYAGGDMSMFVFLPKRGLGEFLKVFGMEEFQAALLQMHSKKGTVELPRFKLENQYELAGVLRSMGMSLAFTEDQADFGAISDYPLSISFVKQKTYVAVNEQGTEAAAVTGIGLQARAVRREEPSFQFVVDRPFFFVIRERQAGLILFLGAISDPR